nr:preprotein translocase subunit SecG [uncultured Prevotella sp.]
MYWLLIVLVVIAAFLMIGVVLIQESKGGGLSSNFSSSNAIMGVRKTTDFIEKATWGLAIAMVVLSVMSAFVVPSASTDQSVIEKAATEGSTTNPNNLPNFGASQQKQTAPANQGTAPATQNAPEQAPAAPAK